MNLYWIILFTFISQAYAMQGIASMMNATQLLNKRDRGTWYTGEGLRNAACYGRNGMAPFNPSASDMIGAMAMRNLEQCYKCMQITNNRNTRLRIIVKIVDKCEACKIGGAVDLTPRAFKMLSRDGLNIGVLDISFKAVRCPKRRRLLPFL
ncbi:hypothetical protein G6F56_008446 [Rhizopus delemar]|uniref:Barwin domain-containing protein n=1 Tax=Rhizopus stolonifer TaxID=4846 RepID=A0A367IXC8_RHIST|nr:hypothetical protein G6F56_008446 [Rhizopus delemar]RCH82322.1 hypothetical protein CU098_004233 [Rhizopus stolonifer]